MPIPLGTYHTGFLDVENLNVNGVLIGAGTTNINSVPAGTNGQVFLAATGTPPIFANLTSMDGSVTFTLGTNSLDLSASDTTGGGFKWNVVTSSTSSMLAGNGYMANRSAGVTFSLPGTAAVGNAYRLVAINAGGWILSIGGGQVVQWGNQTATNNITSTTIGDAIEIVCSLNNTDFYIVSCQGNISFS